MHYEDTPLEDLFHGCPLLEVLTLHQPTPYTNTTLQALFQHCTHLAELELHAIRPSYNINSAMSIITTPNTTLTKLTIIEDALSAGALCDIVSYCTNLREVHFHRCKHIVTDGTVEALADNCHMIEALTLDSCAQVTISGVTEVMTRCTSLRELFLWSMPINDNALIQQSQTCPKLNRLELHSCKGVITEAGILAVVDTCELLTELTVYRCDIELTPTLVAMKRGTLYTHVSFNYMA